MIPSWGDIPGWLEALATVGAFGGVAWPLWKANGDRHRTQATQIDYCLWGRDKHFPSSQEILAALQAPMKAPEPPKIPEFVLGVVPKSFDDVYLTILNGSGNSIHEVKLSTPAFDETVLVVGKVMPGYHTRRLVDFLPNLKDVDVEYSLGNYMPFMQFIDNDNREWQRDAQGGLSQREKNQAWL